MPFFSSTMPFSQHHAPFLKTTLNALHFGKKHENLTKTKEVTIFQFEA